MIGTPTLLSSHVFIFFSMHPCRVFLDYFPLITIRLRDISRKNGLENTGLRINLGQNHVRYIKSLHT